MHECVTCHSLLFQVSLVSNQHHGEVISVLDSQDLGVEFLDLMVAVGRTEGKNQSTSKDSYGFSITGNNVLCTGKGHNIDQLNQMLQRNAIDQLQLSPLPRPI